MNFINSNQLALIYFSSPGCSVCEVLLPKLQELLKNYPLIRCARINAEANPWVVGQFSIMTLPGLLFHVNGKEAVREARFISLPDLENKLERICSMMQ